MNLLGWRHPLGPSEVLRPQPGLSVEELAEVRQRDLQPEKFPTLARSPREAVEYAGGRDISSRHPWSSLERAVLGAAIASTALLLVAFAGLPGFRDAFLHLSAGLLARLLLDVPADVFVVILFFVGVCEVLAILLMAIVREARSTLRSISSSVQRRRTRALIGRYGPARDVTKAGRVIDHDLDSLGEPRRLWRAPRHGDYPLVLLEVANSTPEPDGSRHRYWLRVPPRMRTCREAVAWTFGLSADAYAPEVET